MAAALLIGIVCLLNGLSFSNVRLAALSTSSPFTAKSAHLVCKPNSKDSSMKHLPLGKHYLVDMYDVDLAALRSLETLAGIEKVASFVKHAGMTLLDKRAHLFGCGGVTAVWLLSESHVSIHTWPEDRFIAIDVYTCGAGEPGLIVDSFEKYLRPNRMAKTFVSRGMEHDVHSKGQLFGHQSSTEVKPVQIPYPSVDPSPVSSSASVKKTHVGISSALNKAQLDGKKGINKMNSLGFARDITIPRGRDNKGNTLADICINGDTLEDDCIMLKNTTLLADVTTPYQRLEIVDTETYGRCMLLDRVTQFCESDNAIYTDQLITRAFDKFKPGAVARDDPIDPKINVQLVGGGDGWVPSAILDRYSDILGNMTAVDIDPVVSEMTQRYFRPAGKVNSFKDTRMNWIYTDAGAWLRDNAAARRASIDIFIIDCTDHTAMAAKILYTQEFYSNVFKMLKPGGIVVQQMNTDSPEYLKFFLEAERVWSSAGFKNLQKWSEYIPSFLGKSVFWMAQS